MRALTSIFTLLVLLSIINFFEATDATTCPKKCLCHSTSVSCVWASLKSIPNDLPRNTTVLDLRYNKIEQLTETSFVNVPNLEVLLLNNNNIKNVSESAFKDLNKLTTLNLQQNGLQSIRPGTFENLPNLEQLYLSQNDLHTLETNSFRGLPHLTKLYLHHNRIKTIETNAFPDLLAIGNLRLDSNPLKCDCMLFWLVDSLLHYDWDNSTTGSADITGFCDQPLSLRHKSLYDLKQTELTQQCRNPTITIQPEIGNNIEENHSVYVKCKAEGYTKPKITWKRNGVELDLRNKNYKLFPDGLKVQRFTVLDEGVYECVATNEVGSVKSKSVALKAAKYGANGTKSVSDFLTGEVTPSSVIVRENDHVQIDCRVKNKFNFPVTWFKNNLAIQEIPGEVRIFENGTLQLLNVQSEVHSGKYDCLAIEPITYIFGSCEVIVNSQPKILSSMKTLFVGAGSRVELECLATGHPAPVITWFKNGNSIVPSERFSFRNNNNILRVDNVQESDTGPYTCMAQNSIGSIERTGEIRVKNNGPRAPRIIVKPFDIDVPQYSAIEIPCKTEGEPTPRIRWLRNGFPFELKPPKFRSNNLLSLRIYNVSLNDSGIYTCEASNIYGNDTASGTVTIIGNFSSENDFHIMRAFQEAKSEVDRAINATINHLFMQPEKTNSPEFLMKIFRYPDQVSRSVVKPADVYSRTLANVRRHISSGLKLNLTNDFRFEDVLSQSQLELIANLSGCVPHQRVANCSDLEFHSKYATFDGTCNNVQHPMWGSSYSAFRRILRPIYENGFNTPVGWNKDNRYHGFAKPHPRLVSTDIIRTHNVTADTQVTHMLMQWGQFLDHDLDHALPSTTVESWEGLDCKKTCTYSEPCFPMEIPTKDPRVTTRRCMDFIRSSAVCGTGDTSVFFHNLHPREQLNQLTSYIDSSQIYGFTRDRSFLHRDLTSDLGLLRGGITSEKGKSYLPTAGTNEVDCRRNLSESNVGCFLAGDIRVNEQVALLAMQTIWFREHNRLATELKKVNPQWSGDTLYLEARKILNAQVQHITYAHWLPLFVGDKGMEMLAPYAGYNANVDASILNEFATAALRIGHTMINPELKRLDGDYRPIPQGHLPLGEAFFAPWRLTDEGGVDPLIRGLFVDAGKLKLPNQNLNDQLIEKLFTAAHAVSLDLAAMNIQRGRDHGLPGYAEYRRVCNLTVPETFEDLQDIPDRDTRNKLKTLYGHPGNMDLWVGGTLENQERGARMGPLFRCILVEQFKRIRDGDRLWYENPSTFTKPQRDEIRKSTLARVLCDNADDIRQITKDVFLLPHRQTPSFVSCENLPRMNLQEWRELK